MVVVSYLCTAGFERLIRLGRQRQEEVFLKLLKLLPACAVLVGKRPVIDPFYLNAQSLVIFSNTEELAAAQGSHSPFYHPDEVFDGRLGMW